ncbi:MAG: YdeI/OmpD-associated family protein [Peptococcaceae bacterium]|nr:YdeI/OmpD-associated family protein [Peptococcaceae bacterium]
MNQIALELNPGAQEAYAKLSYTHKKEYFQWITGAKKTETRAARIEKVIQKLLNK